MGRRGKRPHELVPTEHRGEARVWYLGRWHSLGPWDEKANAPSAAAAARLDELRAVWAADPTATPPRRGSPLMPEAWEEWRASPDAPPEHSRDYKLVARLLLIGPPSHLETPTDKFTSSHLLELRGRLVKKKLARWTISRRVAIVRQFFAWAVAKGYATADTLHALNTLPPVQGVKEKEERGIATAEEVEAVAGAMTSQAADLLRLLALTGARPSELCRLTVGSVRRAGVWRSKKGLAVDLGVSGVWAGDVSSKMRRKGIQRVIFFGPAAQALLAGRLDGRALSLPLFVTDEGKAYTAPLLLRYVKLACERLGCERITPYMIRHGVAARVQQEFGAESPGLGYLAAQAVLGHAIKGATSGYAGVDYQAAARVMAAMG